MRSDATGRWALLKLLTGALRVGVSARLAKTAVAEMAGFKVEDIEEVWQRSRRLMQPLFAWLEGRAPSPMSRKAPVFRPLMLSHALEERTGRRSTWQSSPPNGNGTASACRSWRRGRDAALFAHWRRHRPELPRNRGRLHFNAVVDGELLVVRNGEVAPFNDLQQRLNRKGVIEDAARAISCPRPAL